MDLSEAIKKYDPVNTGKYIVTYCLGNMRGRNANKSLLTEVLHAENVYDAIMQIKKKHGPTSECKNVERMG